MNSLIKFVGIPYNNNGNNFNGCDCYGLVCLFYSEILGVILPDLSGQYRSPDDMENIGQLIQQYHEEWEPSNGKWGDVLLFRGLSRTGNRAHLGLYLDKGFMLHTLEGIDSCVESFESSLWKNRLNGIYSYKKRTLI